MKIKTLLALSAAILFTTALPATAQTYGSGNSYGDTNTTTSQKSAEEIARKKAKKEAKKRAKKEKKMREMEKAKQELMDAEEAKMAKEHGMMKKEDAMMKKEGTYGSGNQYKEKSNNGLAIGKPDNCPPNTRPQDNGTCMLISGNLPVN